MNAGENDRRLAGIGRRSDPGIDAEICRQYHALPIESCGNALPVFAAGGNERAAAAFAGDNLKINPKLDYKKLCKKAPLGRDDDSEDDLPFRRTFPKLLKSLYYKGLYASPFGNELLLGSTAAAGATARGAENPHSAKPWCREPSTLAAVEPSSSSLPKGSRARANAG